MAFLDPSSVTIGGVTYSLSRIATGGTSGKFQDPSKLVDLSIVPSTTKAGRRVNAARLTLTKTTSDPLVSTTNVEVSATVTVALNMPQYGFTPTEINNLTDALMLFLTGASALTGATHSNQTKLINQES